MTSAAKTSRLVPIPPHAWDLPIAEALALQRELAGRVATEGEPKDVKLIAGCDCSFDKASDTAFGVVVVLRWPELDVVEEAAHAGPTPFPYVPGLLSFREGPILIEAFRKLRRRPDLILFDGQGQAHPRGLGIASHMGLLLGIPSIGAAKSRLYGAEPEAPAMEQGGVAKLLAPDGRVIGLVLRTRARVKPIYVSVGHGLSLDAARRWTLAVAGRYRAPLPTRLADSLAAKTKSAFLERKALFVQRET
ncbi:MAG: endonuclease V [Myxococcales bacterium]|nr:MAG: endonuclease V [Myxococcales bacterium]